MVRSWGSLVPGFASRSSYALGPPFVSKSSYFLGDPPPDPRFLALLSALSLVELTYINQTGCNDAKKRPFDGITE
jgi:hypothetical protein